MTTEWVLGFQKHTKIVKFIKLQKSEVFQILKLQSWDLIELGR